MKLTVTNKTGGVYGVNALVDGVPRVVDLKDGETWEGEFDDNEAKALNGRTGWEVKGYSEPKGGQQSNDVAGDVAQITQERDDAKAKLQDIINLFDSDEVDELNVKSAVERLIQDAATKPAETTNDEAFNSPLNDGKTDLAAAVALLDDKNDDHWTDAGKPSIEALKGLTGGNVTRAQVDALPTQRERAK